MESIGGAYGRGYALGQGDRQIDQSQNNAYDRIYGNRQPIRGQSTGAFTRRPSDFTKGTISKTPTASEIRSLAIEDALNMKQKELELERMGLENEKINMANQGMEYGLQRQKSADMQAGVDAAQGRADQLREQNVTSEQNRKNQMTQNAVQSLYTGQPDGFIQFFDVFGAPGISIDTFKKGPDGSIEVFFNQGESEKFKDANDVIQKLLMPAAAIASGISGKGTASDKDNISNRKWAIEQLSKAGNTEPSEEDIQKKMSTLTGQPAQGMQIGAGAQGPQGYKRTPEYGGNMATGKVDSGVTDNYMSRKDPSTGKEIRSVIDNGKVVDLVQDPDGKWRLPYGKNSDQKQGMAIGQPESEEGTAIERRTVTKDKLADLKQELLDNGYSYEEADAYIKKAKKMGKI